MFFEEDRNRRLRRIRILLGLVIVALLLSGLSSLPLLAEAGAIDRALQASGRFPAVSSWMATVHRGLRESYAAYPFLGYGTDWLAFGHFVIAIFFLGPLYDPKRNLWVMDAGIIACVLVVPTALLCGAAREIPLWWRLIDCSFGIIGIIPLWIARRLTLRLAH